MSKRPPVVNYTEMLSIMDNGGDYAAFIECTERHGVWWVHRLYVKPDYRKRGYALMLARRAVERWGHRELWVNVWSYQDQPLTDEQLKTLYRRYGFEPTSTPGTLRRPPTEAA
jgi:GNAT superfamily N-acetyltransferase